MLAAKLLLLRVKLRGLEREFRRLRQESLGIEWALKENERDTVACLKQISDLEAAGRIKRLQERFKVMS